MKRQDDGTDISGATVLIRGPETHSGTTDASGVVLFSGIAPGEYRIRAGHPNFESKNATTSVVADTSNTTTVQLVSLITVHIELQDEYGDPYVGQFDLILPTGQVLQGESTDSQGSWSRNNMTTGRYTVKVTGQSITLVQ